MAKHRSQNSVSRKIELALEPKTSVSFRFFCALITCDLLHIGGRAPILGLLRIDMLMALGAVVAYWGFERNSTPRVAVSVYERNVSKWLLVLFAYILVTVPFVEWPGSVLRNGFPTFLKATAFYFLVVWSIGSTRQLKAFIFLYTALQTIRVLEPVFMHVKDGYWGGATYIGGGEYMERLSGAPLDVINSNGLAYIVVSTLPLVFLLQRSMTFVWKAIAWAVMGVMVYALILTSSRSGFVMFVLLILLWVGQSRHKVTLVLGLSVAVVVIGGYLTELQMDRYLSLVQSDKRGSASAEGRLEGIKADFQVALRRPIFGHGLGTSAEANAHYRGYGQLSHNLYTEVAQELGFVGLGLFVAFVIAAVKSAWHATRSAARAAAGAGTASIEPTVLLVTQGIVVLMIVDLIFSLASYGLSQSHWYLLAGLSVVAVRFMAGGTGSDGKAESRESGSRNRSRDSRRAWN